MSHATRKRINHEYNQLGYKEFMEDYGDGADWLSKPVWVPKSERPSPNEPQDMWLYPGLILIAYITSGKINGIHNGQLFEVCCCGGQSVVLEDVESETFDTYEFPIDFVRHNLRLGFAFTNVGCQGRSLGNFEKGDDYLGFSSVERGLTVWDTESQHFRLAHLFTGVSRCRSGALLQVV